MRDALVLVFVLAVAFLVGCGGGTAATTGDPAGSVLLFSDDFSSGTLLPNWMPTDFANVGIDGQAGAGDAPCLLVRDAGGSTAYATANVAPWSAAGGLDIRVRVCLPPDSMCQQSPALVPSPVVEIVCTDTGAEVAQFTFVRGHDDGSGRAPTELVYWINEPMYAGIEDVPAGSLTGQFIDIGFHIAPNGDAHWTRDGVTTVGMVEGNASWPFRMDRSYTLRLRGGGTADGIEAFDMRFDDVEVRR